IANRRSFDEALRREWRRGQRASRWLSLALIDVDHFKQFNDCFGHLTGDECLKAIAGSLVESARRAGEVAARYGGEEFALLLPDTDPEMMQDAARKLLHRVAFIHTSSDTPDVRLIVTVSIGALSLVVPREETEMSALAAADLLLYEAKAD